LCIDAKSPVINHLSNFFKIKCGFVFAGGVLEPKMSRSCLPVLQIYIITRRTKRLSISIFYGVNPKWY